MLKNLNSKLQQLSKISKKVSDLNSIEQLIKGNTTPIKKKIDNKIKNNIWKFLK